MRPPYDSMYDDMEFKVPYSGKAALKKEPSLPGWSALNLDINQAWSTIDELESDGEYFKSIASSLLEL